MRETEKIPFRAQWIWADDNTRKNDWVVFRKSFEIDTLPERAEVLIGVDTKYWMYVNGSLAVCEGGLFRESLHGCGYADRVDVASHLKKGRNVIAILVWYYGNSGRNNIDSTRAGMIMECGSLGIFSDENFLCMRHPGYGTVEGHSPSRLYGGDDICYRAGTICDGFEQPDFDDSAFSPAVVYENEVWGDCYERPIPMHRFSAPASLRETAFRDGLHHYSLAHAMTFSPWLKVKASGGEILRFDTDRSVVPGGPGDHHNRYNSQIFEYVCKKGDNEFRFPAYLYGEELTVSVPPSLSPEIGIIESGYDCDITGSFRCDNELLNRLVDKAARTLYVCMRDNFMDCPDRERGQWIGDLSVQVPQVMFLLSPSARKLVKKSIYDFINLRQGDVLVGNVPGAHCGEMSAQILNAISEWGLLAQYYHYTSDKKTLLQAFEPVVRYLQLWQVKEDGTITRGNDTSGWHIWYDHLYNQDIPVLRNAWYYSALSFAQTMASLLDDHRFDDFLSQRKDILSAAFEKNFWNGRFYASGNFVDDRANAMAVLSGLCPKERYPDIRDILLSVFNSTVYMENYILTALCEMGYYEEAYRRMMSRYYNLASNENSTLWEDFFIQGTKNHAWSGAPATIAFRYFLGLDSTDGFRTFTVNPVSGLFDHMEASFMTKQGPVKVSYHNGKTEIHYQGKDL